MLRCTIDDLDFRLTHHAVVGRVVWAARVCFHR